jgi:hypothetical protein
VRGLVRPRRSTERYTDDQKIENNRKKALPQIKKPRVILTVKKETTVQAYGDFWDAFYFLKSKQEEKVPGWSKLKLSALTMACFAIEAFANHIGSRLNEDWENNGAWDPPDVKLKKIIKDYNLNLDPGKPPFQTVIKIMKWRNKVAHGKTETFVTEHKASLETYDKLLGTIEKTKWQKFYFQADLDKIQSDCEKVMELIHKKTLKNMDWFLGGARHIGSAEI